MTILAAAGDGPVLKTVANVPIVSTGTYSLAGNPYPGGETTFTEDDLRDAVAATEDPAVVLPRLKLGHFSEWGDAEPAFGKVGNLRIGDNGQTIYGDYIGVPAWLAEVMPTAYPNRSIEASFNVKTPTGKEYRMVISALALLGVVLPGVATLDDLAGLYTEVAPDGLEIEAGESVVAKVGGEMKLKLPGRKAQGAVNAEDIRRAYYDALGNDQWAWWIRAMYVGDGDDHLIVDDDDGGLYRVSFDASGEEVEFGEPEAVKIEYVEAGAKEIHTKASGDPAMAYASRSESRPGTTEQEDQMDRQKLIEKLGLPEDATEEDILNAIPTKDESPEEKAAEETPSVQPPGDSEGNPADQGGETATPSPQSEEQPEPVAASGAVPVDPETLERLQRDAAAGRQVADRLARQDREAIVDEAIKAGKFPPSRRDHYLTLMAADEDGAKEIIAGLAPGLVPVEEQGGAPGEGQEAVAAYDPNWLSPAERARAAGQQPVAAGSIEKE